MKHYLSILTTVGLLAGCAGPNPPPSASSGMILSKDVIALLESDASLTLGDERIHCERRQPIGTRFSQTVCQTREELDQQREWSLRDAYGAGSTRVD
ncbi:MAG: hypothetical protein ACNA7J_04635 [Wenzhouxiangella sp.]